MRKRATILFPIIMVSLIFVNGCLISHHSHTNKSAPYNSISAAKLDSIEPGLTTKDWVIDTFGNPTREKHLQDGGEVLIYENIEKTIRKFSIFLVFSTHSTEEQKETLSFMMKDDVVTSYWFDSDVY